MDTELRYLLFEFLHSQWVGRFLFYVTVLDLLCQPLGLSHIVIALVLEEMVLH
jgi:hypothetical protein